MPLKKRDLLVRATVGARILCGLVSPTKRLNRVSPLFLTTQQPFVIMAPPTRLNPYRTPPRSPLAGRDATTRRRTKFFDALTDNKGAIPLTRISKKCGISESCGRKWKEIWQNEGDEGKRHPRQRSKVLGRNSQVTKSMCKMLCSPSRNPVRKQPYEAQIAYHKLPVKTRQLQNKLREYTKRGARYKCAFVKKVISNKNKEEREKYGNDYKFKPLLDFFDHIVFTDEAHVDPISQAQGRVLREQGTRDLPENIEERPPLKGVRFHIAAWISWWGKADKLEFYNDEKDEVVEPAYPHKPRQRPTTEFAAEYEAWVKEWDAGKPHKIKVKVQGNAITQKYYVDRLLPIYVQAIESMREIDDKP